MPLRRIGDGKGGGVLPSRWRGGALAALIRLRAAKARLRRDAARPTGVEPCLIGDANGIIVASINATTGLPTDHIWVRMRNHGNAPMIARNLSGHAWT